MYLESGKDIHTLEKLNKEAISIELLYAQFASDDNLPV